MKGAKRDNVESREDHNASNTEIMAEADMDTTGRHRG